MFANPLINLFIKRFVHGRLILLFILKESAIINLPNVINNIKIGNEKAKIHTGVFSET